ncbi:DUF177 domain-containing protein [Marivibrio halodurans]|uniref:DUF177 domain-containing protein n=1 Tax=Marivibrio halodurans TaxID=2039722 RepID=A0A8J7SKV8_9PROT|nr:YceD family protein [Marivibrio halodurans]MBP5855786.1 DUF177 domain-containing protein [Marivibrio halodurans]
MSEPADIDRPPEFSVPVEADDVPSGGKTYRLEADEAARAALAERLDLVALDRLAGEVALRPLAGGPMLIAMGRVEAELAQRCVVTLEPLPVSIKERFSVEYGPPEQESVEETEREFTLDDPDPPEEIVNGRIDLGELLVQRLAVLLDPHPRKAGVDMSTALDDVPAGRRAAIEEEEPAGPFAALSKLKK